MSSGVEVFSPFSANLVVKSRHGSADHLRPPHGLQAQPVPPAPHHGDESRDGLVVRAGCGHDHAGRRRFTLTADHDPSHQESPHETAPPDRVRRRDPRADRGRARRCQGSPPYEQGRFVGRIAWSADGNHNDPDDWAASPLALVIFAACGARDRLVHFDYNCILHQTDRNGKRPMPRASWARPSGTATTGRYSMTAGRTSRAPWPASPGPSTIPRPTIPSTS